VRTFGLLCTLILLTGIRTMAAEAERQYYTESVIRTAVENIERHDWAKKERDRIVAEADKWLNYDDATLRLLVTPPEIPRAVVAHVKGAPVMGEELNKIGRYSWIISFDRPYKVKSPVDGAIYPSNDFLAYYRSGLDERGVFHPDRADRSLLTGPYPDDGWGCKVEGFEKPFWFVGVYAHWSVVRLLLPAIENLSKAYLLTDDPRYAHACAVLLWQLADYYPRYRYEMQSRYAKEVQPHYLGRLLYHTWESLYTCHTVPPAYDAVKPAIEHDRALMELTGQTPEEIRRYIEERILRTMARDITDGSGRIQGNYGMHQVSLLRIAAVLKGRPGNPSSHDMVAWVLRNPNPGNYAQLGLEDALNNLLHRDGFPFENPGYNTMWVREISQIVSALEPEERARLLAMPRFRKLFTWPIRMAVAGKWVPSHGDGGHIWQGLIGWGNRVMEPAFRFYRDPIFARALAQSGVKATTDLFSEYLGDAIEAAAARLPGKLGTRSELLPGAGFASLQTTNDGNTFGLAALYGYYRAHRHYDLLNIDLYALWNDGWGYALLPDLGYPETADSYDPRRFGFLSHTVCHNTVMIDARRQEIAGGRLHLYEVGPFVKALEMSAESAYPGRAHLYRRTLLLVEVAPDKAYVLDIFRVRGGAQHDWIIHGTDAEFTSDPALPPARQTGTLAGPDVGYGEFYDDRRYADDNKAHVPYYLYKGSGFQWLFNVQEAALRQQQVVQWQRGKVILRCHFLDAHPEPGTETVFACDGIPQRRKPYPDSIKFVLRRRTGENLESIYVTLFEMCSEKPFVESVRLLPVAHGPDMPVAVEVVADGKRQVILSRLENGRTALADGAVALNARAAVLEWSGDALRRAWVLDDAGSTGLPFEPARAVGAIVKGVDYDGGRVTLDGAVLPPSVPENTWAVVESEHHASAVPVVRVIDGTSFSVGDDDLYEGLVHVQLAKGREIRYVPRHGEWLQTGMSVVNEAGAVVGRLSAVTPGYKADPGKATLSRGVTLDDFPDADGDGRRSCRVCVIGPGDRITLHASTRWSAP